ncbi:MAG TPA: hypothetical protein VFJ68_06200 [Casimicrobiaceae bacterium]|nr:hypothetical protein [Casimicrobiaceae bacterium]
MPHRFANAAKGITEVLWAVTPLSTEVRRLTGRYNTSLKCRLFFSLSGHRMTGARLIDCVVAGDKGATVLSRHRRDLIVAGK